MMEIFAICVAIAGLVYLRQVFTSMEHTARRKSAPEYSIYGDLILPSNLHEWVHLQLTNEPVHDPVDICVVTSYPDAYIDPAAYKHFLCTNTLPEGVIAFRVSDKNFPLLRSWLADRCSNLRCNASDIECANVAVKDSLQFSENLGWGFFRLNQAEFSE